jgi:glucosyl-dolichyl phosphate glucuronosyltransferase
MTVECTLSPPSVQIEVSQPPIEGFEYPKISVVIVSFNRPKHVRRTIDSVIKQSVQPHEIIVIDDGSKPRLEFKTNFENFKLIHLDEEAGLSSSRNLGVSLASGDYVAFIDDDAVASPNWLEEIEKAILDGADVLGGPLVPHFEAAPPGWWTEKDYGSFASVGNASFEGIWGANMVFSKKVFDHVGLFNPHLGRQKGKLMGREESELMEKAKSIYQVAFVHSAVVAHSVPAKRLNLKYILRWRYYDGVSERRMTPHSIREFRETTVSLFKSVVLFLKYSFKRNPKERIRHLINMMFYLGKIA